MSLAATVTLPAALTWPLPVLETCASTFIRTKLSEIAPAPAELFPPAPANVTLTIWPPTIWLPAAEGRSSVVPARSNELTRSCRPWALLPMEVSMIARLTMNSSSSGVAGSCSSVRSVASESVAASLMCVVSTTIA